VSTGLGFALENQTRPVYSSAFFRRGANTYVVAHELSYQWFGREERGTRTSAETPSREKTRDGSDEFASGGDPSASGSALASVIHLGTERTDTCRCGSYSTCANQHLLACCRSSCANLPGAARHVAAARVCRTRRPALRPSVYSR
jgi:hypothetical protein